MLAVFLVKIMADCAIETRLQGQYHANTKKHVNAHVRSSAAAQRLHQMVVVPRRVVIMEIIA